MPLAIMGKSDKNPGRVADDYISFIDAVPTILKLAEIGEDESGMVR